ncbi:hypothetical protein SORBI_3001G183550 [Sorghum bicolor]|uniref:Uncharacterized protein n=1 Tax=Sorghum bicolor TaxID=4558 RepID=A0A1Z5S6B4_SORBI|nr:hypothetical protein SORBI_3001G183550 [Sorghum bicolor]
MPAVPLSSHSPVVKSMAPSSLPLFATQSNASTKSDDSRSDRFPLIDDTANSPHQQIFAWSKVLFGSASPGDTL